VSAFLRASSQVGETTYRRPPSTAVPADRDPEIATPVALELVQKFGVADHLRRLVLNALPDVETFRRLDSGSSHVLGTTPSFSRDAIEVWRGGMSHLEQAPLPGNPVEDPELGFKGHRHGDYMHAFVGLGLPTDDESRDHELVDEPSIGDELGIVLTHLLYL